MRKGNEIMLAAAHDGLSVQMSDGAGLREDTLVTAKGENNQLVLGKKARVGDLGRPKLESILGKKDTLVISGVTLAGSLISDARTILTSSIEESHVAVAGVPGKIVSRNRTWDRALL